MYYNNYNVLPIRARAFVLLIQLNIFIIHACVNTCSKVGLACFTAGRAEPNLISGAGFFLTGARNNYESGAHFSAIAPD